MAHQVSPTESATATEQQDRGLFGLFGKKKEEHPEAQCHQQAAAPAPVHCAAPPAAPPQHHEAHGDAHGLHGKLHRTHSSSSSSSSDEDEGGEKKEGGRKKKGLKDKIKEKLPGHHADDGNKTQGQCQAHDAAHEPDGEKKGVLEKIKEKLPGHHCKEGENDHSDKQKQQHGY